MMQSEVLRRAHERSDQSHLRMLHCNHAESTKISGTSGPSMVAAFALAFVSSSYTIRGRSRAARYKTLVGAYCSSISLAFPKMKID